jgi:hypothetical protein
MSGFIIGMMLALLEKIQGQPRLAHGESVLKYWGIRITIESHSPVFLQTMTFVKTPNQRKQFHMHVLNQIPVIVFTTNTLTDTHKQTH